MRDEPLPALLAKEQRGMLRAAMSYLKVRDRRIVSLRYGINVEPRSVSEIAQLEGMTVADVRKRLKWRNANYEQSWSESSKTSSRHDWGASGTPDSPMVWG